MFPWLKEYEIFQEETFNRFLRNSGIINKNTIPQNHMVVQKIEQMLQHIENIWAKQNMRTSARVQVTVAPDLLHKTIAGQPHTEEEKEVSSTYYDCINQVYHIAWNPRENSFELIMALWHESMHHCQSIGCHFSQEEQSLVWIERACKPFISNAYWTRYTEMTARIEEAKAYMSLIQKYQNQWSNSEKASILKKCERMLQLIDNKTSKLSINQLQKQQIICLNKEKIPPKLLPAAFDNKYSRWSCRKPAIKFLQEQAPQLYNAAFEQLQKTKQELAHAIHQAKLCAALEKHELEINRLTQLANKYHIPILAEPYPVHPHSFCKIYGDARAEKYIQNAIKEGKYNIALAPTRDGSVQLIYDEHPIQRPCNSNNSQPQCDITNDNKNSFTQNDQYSLDAFDTEER